jgi:hypothetical protein
MAPTAGHAAEAEMGGSAIGATHPWETPIANPGGVLARGVLASDFQRVDLFGQLLDCSRQLPNFPLQ